MNSCLYDCSVVHHRLRPKGHRFEHGLFLFLLDLDELDLVAERLRFFSHNRRNLYTFRDDDYEPAGRGPLKARMEAFLRARGALAGPAGRILLLTLPRVLGYIFNPISIYYCFAEDGAPACAVAEVGNTFGERKLFLLPGGRASSGDGFAGMESKHFYVSPFSPLDLQFDFRIGLPGERLEVRIDDLEEGRKTLASTLTGRRRALTSGSLWWMTLKYPLVTLRVITLIHWQALRLWLKRLPVHRKSAAAALQRGVLRPHPSLTSDAK